MAISWNYSFGREGLNAHDAEGIVRVDGLSKTYGRVAALGGVGFSIHAGEILGLIGPNGAGKTTLFECVAGLEPADGKWSSAAPSGSHGNSPATHGTI